MKQYTQCLLENRSSNQVAWIEKIYADKGLLVTLENEGETIWKVKEVYPASTTSFDDLILARKTQKEFASKLK
jgi:hypothetical protein